MLTDLHLHTNYSDGKLSVTDTIAIANQRNIKMISITDHDSVDGIKEAIEFSRNLDMICISGLELSCRNDNIYIRFPQDISVHILAYNLDYEKKELREFLNQYHLERKQILLELIADLVNYGFDVKYEDISVIAGSQMRIQDIINHINSSFCSKEKKEIYLELANSYYKKIFEKDCTLGDAIKIIKHSGGIPVLAHAFFSYRDYDVIKNSEQEVQELINYLYELGIEGIEVFYSKFNNKQTMYLLDIAKRNNLMITAGSDFHGTPMRKNMIDYKIHELEYTNQKLVAINKYK